MANDFYTSAGSSVAVSAALPATEDQAGYELLTFTDVGGFLTLDDSGDTFTDVAVDFMNDRRTKHKKGQKDGGNPNLTCTFMVSDAGQAILEAALASDCDISIKITLNDTPCNGGITPTVLYKEIQVMSDLRTGLGGPNNPLGRTFNLMVNSNTVQVDAA